MRQINQPTKIWYIAGIGAMGGIVAANFCKAGLPIHLLLKNDKQLFQYNEKKITVANGQKIYSCNPPAVVVSSLGKEQIHNLICCVKAYDITALLTRLKFNLNDNSIIILIHNGMGVLEEIKAQLPSLRIIQGISTLGAYVDKPFFIRSFMGGELYLGKVAGEFNDSEINRICTMFSAAGIPNKWQENIQIRIWDKFAINCSINMLTALFACKNGQLLEHYDLIKQLTYELSEVARANGMVISAEDLLTKIVQVLHHTAGNYSSMYMDVFNHKPIELGYLNEQLTKLAQKKGIFMPVHTEVLNQFYSKFPQYTFRK